MNRFLEISEFEHNKIYYVLHYCDGIWYPKEVKIYKDKQVVFEDNNEPRRFYCFYDLYVLKKGKDLKDNDIWQIMIFDTFEEAKKTAEFENSLLLEDSVK